MKIFRAWRVVKDVWFIILWIRQDRPTFEGADYVGYHFGPDFNMSNRPITYRNESNCIHEYENGIFIVPVTLEAVEML